MILPNAIHIVFDGPPEQEGGRFVEVETPDGRSISVGEWIQKGDYWHLVIPMRRTAVGENLPPPIALRPPPPPAPPPPIAFPPGAILSGYELRPLCPECGIAQKWQPLKFWKSRGCIQPECPNYYKRKEADDGKPEGSP